MKSTVDVAIIGGGPAGSTLAALLAKRGASVALIDRDEFPRDKVCGEFLSYDALPVLAALGVDAELDRAGAPQIDRCRIVARGGMVEFPFPQSARGVSRMLLDDLLFRAAASCGTEVREGWSAELIEPGVVTITRRGDTRTIEAAAIVGAWGRWGRFDTRMERPFVQERTRRSFGFKRHYFALEAVPGDAGRIDLYSFAGGYLGVNAVEGGLTNICGLVAGSRLSGHKGRWDSFVEEIRREEPALDAMYARHREAQKTFLTSEPVIFRAKSPVESGIFMIGDASGIIDPLTGNGMAMAIQSALLVAPLLLRLIARPDDRRAIEREYARRHRKTFHARLGWSRRTARILSNPALLDRVVRVVRTPAAGRFLLSHTRAESGAIERMIAEWEG